jgi:hypothetical protein
MREEINDQNLNPWEGTNIFSSNCSMSIYDFDCLSNAANSWQTFPARSAEKFGCSGKIWPLSKFFLFKGIFVVA